MFVFQHQRLQLGETFAQMQDYVSISVIQYQFQHQFLTTNPYRKTSENIAYVIILWDLNAKLRRLINYVCDFNNNILTASLGIRKT